MPISELKEPLIPENNRFQGVVPGVEPQQQLMSATYAFTLAVMVGLPALLTICYAASFLGDEAALLFVAKPQYDTTTGQAEAYAPMRTNYTDPSNPNSGLNMTDDVSINNYVLLTAYSLAENVMVGGIDNPQTVIRIVQLVTLCIAVADFLRRSLRIALNNGGALNASTPVPVEADIVQAAHQMEGVVVNANDDNGPGPRLDAYYINDSAGIAEMPDTDWYGFGAWKRSWYQLHYNVGYNFPHHFTHDKLFSWMPSLAESITPITVIGTSVLVIGLMQKTSLDYNNWNNYPENYDSQMNYYNNNSTSQYVCSAAPGTNQTGWEQQMICDAGASQYGVLESANQEMSSLNLTPQLLWYVLTAVVVGGVPLVDQIYKYRHRNVGGQPNASVVFSAVMAVIQDLPAIVLLTLGVRAYVKGGFSAYNGNAIYDDKKTKLYDFAIKPISSGGLGKNSSQASAFAVSNARSFYQGYMYGTPLLYSMVVTTTLLSTGAVCALDRFYVTYQLNKDGVIECGHPYTELEKLQYQAENRRTIEAARENGYHLPVFIDSYLNYAIEQPELRKTAGHRAYERRHSFAHETGLAKLYNPLKIGVLAALTAVVITNIYTVWDVQSLYDDHYNNKYDAEELAGLCKSANQMMDCISKADQYGAIYALEDFMKKVTGIYGTMLFWGPVAAAAGSILLLAAPKIFSFLAVQIKACCVKTADLVNQARNALHTDVIPPVVRAHSNSDDDADEEEAGQVAYDQRGHYQSLPGSNGEQRMDAVVSGLYDSSSRFFVPPVIVGAAGAPSSLPGALDMENSDLLESEVNRSNSLDSNP